MSFRTLASIGFLLSGTLLASAAHAEAGRGGLFVEPGITYEIGSTTTSYATGDSNGTNNGFGLMGRLGFHVSDAFFIAADARYSKPHFTDGRNDASSDAYQVGPVIGVQMPVAGLRVWAEYVAQAQLDPGGSNNYDLKFKNGTGYTIGAGLHFLSVSANLEYQKLNYATTETQNVGGFALGDTNNTTLKDNAWILSLTFPLEL